MATDVKASKRVNHERLVRFVQAAFEKLGVPNADAQIGADALVAADLRGVDTHGVIRFSPQAWYVKWLSEGSMTARPNIRIISESASTALIDGDRGMGMVIGHRAMELAVAKAKQSGIGMVGVRNSRHYGMSAYYAMQALPHDMIGIAMTNASRQVVPTFGREARFGTNPMCFAVPADKELPFVLDMATTTAAAGKLELAARMEKAIPLGWALNEKAEVTDDPRVGQQARHVACPEARHLRRIEAGERAAERLALPQDREPRESRLEPLETDLLEEPAIVRDGTPPLVVVIGDVVLLRPAPEAAGTPVRSDDHVR